MSNDNKTMADVQPGFTTGHCQQNNRPGGCQLHNLQCGWPNCDRKPVAPSLADAQPGGRVRLGDSRSTRAATFLRQYLTYLRSSPRQGLRPRWCDVYEALEIAIEALSAQPSPGGQDALDCIGRIEEAIEFRVPHDIYAAVHGELAGLKAALAARQPVGISAEWVLGYLNTDAPEESREAIRNAFTEYAALSGARQPVESEENVAADTYWTLAEMIEPHVQREGINPDGVLPASVHDSVAILLEHWLRTRQPVGEPVGTICDRDGVFEIEPSESAHDTDAGALDGRVVYLAPPAQAVDLGQFRAQVAELLRREFDLEVADPGDHRHDDGAEEADRIAGTIAALIDSQAVGK